MTRHSSLWQKGSEQYRRERHDRNRCEDADVDQRPIPVGTLRLIELCLLSDPKHARRRKAHRI
jgi:hypothetical protein